jgi:hypothetical protein
MKADFVAAFVTVIVNRQSPLLSRLYNRSDDIMSSLSLCGVHEMNPSTCDSSNARITMSSGTVADFVFIMKEDYNCGTRYES